MYPAVGPSWELRESKKRIVSGKRKLALDGTAGTVGCRVMDGGGERTRVGLPKATTGRARKIVENFMVVDWVLES
jgi:hypothetical protein